CLSVLRLALQSAPFPYTTLFRSRQRAASDQLADPRVAGGLALGAAGALVVGPYDHRGECGMGAAGHAIGGAGELAHRAAAAGIRSEEHTSELQSRENLVCRLLLE